MLTEPRKLWPHYCKGWREKRNREVKRNEKGGVRTGRGARVNIWLEGATEMNSRPTPPPPHTHTSKAEKLRPQRKERGKQWHWWVIDYLSFIYLTASFRQHTVWSAYPEVKVK